MKPYAPIEARQAAAWRPWVNGPSDLQLICEGNAPARVLYAVYQRWPVHSGRARISRMLGRIADSFGGLKAIPFRTWSGAELVLDLGSDQFAEIAGVLPTEPLELSVMLRLLRPGDLFVDVGAHVGLYSAHAAGVVGRHGRCVTIEPDPENCRRLRSCFEHLPWVEIRQVGASDSSGTRRLVGAGELGARVADTGGIEIMVERLDSLIPANTINSPCVVKIDVERHEPSVLRGMTRWTDSGVRPLLQVEYLPDAPDTGAGYREMLNGVIEDLTRRDYAYFAMSSLRGDCVPIRLGDAVDASVVNILAVPNEMRARLSSAFSDARG